MKVLKKMSEVIDKICGAAIVVMIAIMVLATAAQIIWRVGSGFIPTVRPLSWSEELTRFLLVWSTFYGATCAYRHGANIAITAVQGIFPDKGKKVMRILVHIVCFILFAALMYVGVMYCRKQVRTTDALPINIPMKWIYSCLPISMAILMFHAFVMILEEIFPSRTADECAAAQLTKEGE